MVDDITRHRWEKGSRNPNDHKPIDALRVTLAQIESGEIQASHIVIIIDERHDDGVYFRQAGERDYIGTLGLIERGKHIMQGLD